MWRGWEGVSLRQKKVLTIDNRGGKREHLIYLSIDGRLPINQQRSKQQPHPPLLCQSSHSTSSGPSSVRISACVLVSHTMSFPLYAPCVLVGRRSIHGWGG